MSGNDPWLSTNFSAQDLLSEFNVTEFASQGLRLN